MENYLLLLLAALLMMVNFVLNKIFQCKAGDSIQMGLCFNAVVGLGTAVCFWIMNGLQVEFTLYSFILAIVTALLSVVYTIIGFRIMSGGKMAYYTLFLMCGGMMVPYVWGLLFLGEPFSWLRMAGLVLITGAIVLSNIGKDKLTRAQILMCIAVFFLNGLLSVVSKHHQIETVLPTTSTTSFVMWSGLTKCIFCWLIFLIMRKKSAVKEKIVLQKRVWTAVAVSAVVSGIAYFLQLVGAAKLPATVVYPFVTGGSIVFTTLAGWLIFKEKPSAKLWIGVALCMVGTLLFL